MRLHAQPAVADAPLAIVTARRPAFMRTFMVPIEIPTTRTCPTAQEPFDIGSADDSLERMTALFAELGDTYRVYAPSRASYTYVVHDPGDVQRVLVSNQRNYTKGVGIDRVKVLLGNGSMTSEGELWQRQRVMLNPLFHRRVVDGFALAIGDANDRLVDRWSGLAERGETLDLSEEMSKLAAEVILRATFGDDLDDLSNGSSANAFRLISADRARDLEFAYRLRSLSKVVLRLVERRRAHGVEHADYLGMLMAARDAATGSPMDDRQLLDEVLTIIVAGHETTAATLSWTWFLLAGDSRVAERLEAEVSTVPEQPVPSFAHLESLGYARQVLQEALRLYPPGWTLSRRTIDVDVLGGYDVAGGTDVLIPLYLIHRDARHWSNPDEFQPERFSAENDTRAPRFAFVPFGGGARHCLGETFAWYEMLMHLAKAARRYRLVRQSDAPVELEARINLRTRHPLRMKIDHRE
jgi:cytochrome P450